MKSIVILGSTATGKSSLAIKLAQKINGEIISCDSMQVYKYMDIGTAKVSKAERELVPHHLIDILEPDESFSAAHFAQLAQQKIQDIKQRGKTPILCGGSGMFIKGLVNGYVFGRIQSDEELRQQLQKEAQADLNALFLRLQKLDEQAAKKIHPHDERRIIRALEIYYLKGQPKTQQNQQKEDNGEFLLFQTCVETELLYMIINERVDKMVEQGLFEEAESLYKYKDCQSMQAIGYKQIYEHMDGMYSKEEAISKIKQATRNYSKRQRTYFRAMPNIHRLTAFFKDNPSVIEEIIKND